MKAKKKVVEESDEEEGSHPWEKTKKIVRQPVKQHDDSDEESHTETRKALFAKTGAVPKAVGSLVNTPNHSDTEKSSVRSGNSPKNPFIESKTANYRKGRGAGSDAEPESMGEVLSRLKNKKQAGGKDHCNSNALNLAPVSLLIPTVISFRAHCYMIFKETCHICHHSSLIQASFLTLILSFYFISFIAADNGGEDKEGREKKEEFKYVTHCYIHIRPSPTLSSNRILCYFLSHSSAVF